MRKKIKIMLRIDKVPNLLSILLLSILVSSCDPVQDLIFVNETDFDITVQIIEAGNSIESIKHNIRNDYKEPINDTTIIRLGTGQAKSDTIDFGLGTWEIHNRLDTFLLYLKEVSIIDEKVTTLIKDKRQLDSLFRINLTGKLNESIVIRIK